MKSDIQFVTPPPQDADNIVGQGLEPYFENAQPNHFWIQSRFRLILLLLQKFKISLKDQPLFEVGCGNGNLQRLLRDTCQTVLEISDMNIAALKIASTRKLGPVYYYDVLQRAPKFQGKYSVIFLLDVLEHIENPIEFLKAVSSMLGPQGKLIINVPARQELYSTYDTANGHFRRYSITSLLNECACADARIIWSQYWGFLFYPILWLRKVMLYKQIPSQKTLMQGFKMPHRLINSFMLIASSMERSLIKKPIIGTSILAICDFPKINKNN